jgi:Fur family transcriptional regulator, iron response regulator
MTKLQVCYSILKYLDYNVCMNNLNITFPLERSDVVSMLQHFKISPTRQRVEIAEFLFQRPQHLSAEKILDGVISSGNRVSRATVYNTMGLFANKGVVREVLIDRERVFYDTNTEVHQHLYNVDTGELTDVYDAEVEMVSVPELPEGLKIVDTDVVFKVTSK